MVTCAGLSWSECKLLTCATLEGSFLMAILAAFGRGGAVFGLILLVVALLKQLILLVGFLLVVIKFAIVIAFVLTMVMIVLAIVRDRSRRKREAEGN